MFIAPPRQTPLHVVVEALRLARAGGGAAPAAAAYALRADADPDVLAFLKHLAAPGPLLNIVRP